MSVNKVNSDGSLKRIAGGTLYADAPLGTILAFGGTTAPAGWMLCQGQTISRTTYAELFAIIGTAFGSGDGSTTFNLPDLREATTKGAGLTGLSNNHMDADGLALGEFIDDRIQSHTHTYTNVHNGTNPSYGRADFSGSASEKYNFDGFTLTTSAPSGRSGATTEVKAVGVNYIIKVMMVSLPTDLDAGVDNKLDARFAGMKIVRKTFSNRSFTANTDTNFDLSDILADVDDLIDFSIMVYQTNSSYYKLPYFSGGPQLYCNAISASRVATIHCGSVAWPASYYVTFTLYIKA